MSATRVAIVEDHPLYREGIVGAIQADDRLHLVAECSTADEAMQAVLGAEIDVVVVDVRLKTASGLDLIQRLKAGGSSARPLVLSAFIEPALIYEAVAAGASGYLPKDSDRRAICQAITAIAHGETAFPETVARHLADEIRRRETHPTPKLTDRERDILELVSQGRSVEQVASELHISPATVKTHLSHTYDKLDVNNRSAAVAKAIRLRLLDAVSRHEAD